MVLSMLLSVLLAKGSPLEVCYSHGQVLEVNNEEVIQWSDASPNGFHDRGHIQGTVLEILRGSSGHTHISVQIGDTAEDAIEVVYANSFGALPAITPGMSLEACGDYITSFKPNGHEPASPDRAIIHWVHASNTDSHDAGFVIIDGTVYGDL